MSQAQFKNETGPRFTALYSERFVRLFSELAMRLRKLFKKPCSQAELNKIVPFGFSLQRQKMVFFLPSK